MLIPSGLMDWARVRASLSRRVNANSQQSRELAGAAGKLIKKGEC